MIFKPIIHLFVARHRLETSFNFVLKQKELYVLLDDVIKPYLMENAKSSEAKEAIESVISVVCESRHFLAHFHNDNVLPIHYYEEWVPKWIELAEMLLNDTRFKRCSVIQRVDDARLEKLRNACKSLLSETPNGEQEKAAFDFAFKKTRAAKAARAFFVISILVLPAIKDCAISHQCTKSTERRRKRSIQRIPLKHHSFP